MRSEEDIGSGARICDRLAELGIVLPKQASSPAGDYVPAVFSGNFIFLSGHLPKKDGRVLYKGKLGDTLSVKEGYAAARLCALECLCSLSLFIGELDDVAQIIKATCFINSTPFFCDHSKVADGATSLLLEIFGRTGIPARSAIGVASLPQNASVELELVVLVRDTWRLKGFGGMEGDL